MLLNGDPFAPIDIASDTGAYGAYGNAEGDAAPAGDAAGDAAGGGGGGGMDAVGAIFIGIAILIDSIIGGVETVKATELSPKVLAARYQTVWPELSTAIQKVVVRERQEHAAYEAAKRAWDAFRRNDSNLKQWMSGPTAHSNAPANTRTCRETVREVRGVLEYVEESNDGGHAYGDTNCRCKSSVCAFKPGKQAQAQNLRNKLWNAAKTLAKTRGGDDAANLGVVVNTPVKIPFNNPEDARKKLRKVTQNIFKGNLPVLQTYARIIYAANAGLAGIPNVFAEQYDAQPVIAASPNMHIAAAVRSAKELMISLLDPAMLAVVFPQDADALEGRLPAPMRQLVLSNIAERVAFGQAPPSMPVPLWALGYTLDEINAIGVVGDIPYAVVQQLTIAWSQVFGSAAAASMFAPPAQDAYGADPITNPDLLGWIRALVAANPTMTTAEQADALVATAISAPQGGPARAGAVSMTPALRNTLLGAAVARMKAKQEALDPNDAYNKAAAGFSTPGLGTVALVAGVAGIGIAAFLAARMRAHG